MTVSIRIGVKHASLETAQKAVDSYASEHGYTSSTDQEEGVVGIINAPGAMIDLIRIQGDLWQEITAEIAVDDVLFVNGRAS